MSLPCLLFFVTFLCSCRYVQSLTFNGKKVEGVEMKYSELMRGGELHFTMGPQPAYLTKNHDL